MSNKNKKSTFCDTFEGTFTVKPFFKITEFREKVSELCRKLFQHEAEKDSREDKVVTLRNLIPKIFRKTCRDYPHK